MNAPLGKIKIDPVEVLRERAEARAYLWAIGEFESLPEAVDVLAVDADRDGIDRDVAQAIIAAEFGVVR